jgi:hypothetical protein
MFSGFHGAVAHHGLALLRMSCVRQAAHHWRGRCLAGHAPGDWRERNRKESDDYKNGVRATHLREIITAMRLAAITLMHERSRLVDLPGLQRRGGILRLRDRTSRKSGMTESVRQLRSE